jgi:hypothetical protein
LHVEQRHIAHQFIVALSHQGGGAVARADRGGGEPGWTVERRSLGMARDVALDPAQIIQKKRKPIEYVLLAANLTGSPIQ